MNGVICVAFRSPFDKLRANGGRNRRYLEAACSGGDVITHVQREFM